MSISERLSHGLSESGGNKTFNQYRKATAAFNNATAAYKAAQQSGDEAAMASIGADLEELQGILTYLNGSLDTADYDTSDYIASAGQSLLNGAGDLPGVKQGLDYLGIQRPSQTLEGQQANRILGVDTRFGKVNPVNAVPAAIGAYETGAASLLGGVGKKVGKRIATKAIDTAGKALGYGITAGGGYGAYKGYNSLFNTNDNQ